MGALSFLSPWFLVGALAVSVPFVLHLLRREETPSLAFTAVRFLRAAPREQHRRRELRDIWLLVLRMLALVVLAISFARPYLRSGEAAANGLTVVALDTSFSMSAKDQFARAQKAAVSLVSSAPTGHRVAAMAFDDRAAVVSPPALERGSARAAINALAPGAGATNYAALFASAGRIFGQVGGRLVVVTDLQRSGWVTDGALPSNVELQVVDVAGPVDNVAVTALRRDGDIAVATISNFGARPRSVRATLTVDGKPLGQSGLNMEPGRTETVRFDGALPGRGAARVAIDDRQGLAADNERYVVLDPPHPPSVLLLSQRENGEDVFYLREAIQAIEGPRAFTVDLVKASERNTLQPERFKAHPVVWLLGTRGLDRRVRDQIAAYLQEGGALLVTAGPMLDPSSFASLFEQAGNLRVESAEGTTFPTSLAPVDTRHPIFAAFGSFASNLGQAEFTQALRIAVPETGRARDGRPVESPLSGGQPSAGQPSAGQSSAGQPSAVQQGAVQQGASQQGASQPADTRIIARFTNGLPALVERAVGQGRVIVFASDVSREWNDLPRQPTFVPFVNETLRYLAKLREQPRDTTLGNVAVAVATKPGVVKMGQPPRPVAVNVDARESRPARMTEPEFTQMVRRTEAEGRSADIVAREQEAGQHWWRYGLIALLLVLVSEGLLARRPAPVSLAPEPVGAERATT